MEKAGGQSMSRQHRKIRTKTLLLLVLTLIFAASCASTNQNAPSKTVRAPRLPVRIGTSPSRPTPAKVPQVSSPTPSSQPRQEMEEKEFEGYAAALQSLPRRSRPAAQGEKIYPIELNLQDADLVETVRVLTDTLGLNYTIDPRVKGKANVRASGKLTRSELLSILETTLLVNGAALVKTGKVYKIVPLDKASAEALPVYTRGAPPVGMTVQLIYLEQTPVQKVISVLKPLVTPGGTISEAPNNSLILVDYPANLEKLGNLIRLIDSRALSKVLVRLVKVNNANPTELIKELEVIFSAYGALTQKGESGVSFLAVPRLNAVMVLAASTALLGRAQHWIKELDLETDMLANVHVYNVENYKAKNLAVLLTKVYGGEVAAEALAEVKPETEAEGAAPGLRGRERETFGVSTPTTQTFGMGGPSEGSAVAGGPSSGVREQAIPLVPTAEAGVVPKPGVRIIPDAENNLLVVVAPPYEWRIISNLLRRLDIMPRQVMNEVMIAEVRLTGELKYGIEWYLNAQLVQKQAADAANGDKTPTLDFLQGPSAVFSPALGGFTFAVRDSLNQFRGLVNMLAQEGKVNILASPHIMAANNQEARIQIGEEVPVLTSQAVPLISQETSLLTQTIQYRSTGIILKVKPQINAKGLITLDITQEVSAAIPTPRGGVTSTPTFTIRKAKTSLITGDNQTIVLGGLIREDISRTASGIPGLRKIPLLGPLFGVEDSKKERTELLVLITPHIITDLEEGARMTREVKDRIQLEELRPR